MMKKTPFILLLILLFYPFVSFAAGFSLSPAVTAKVNKAQSLIEKNKTKQAITLLSELKPTRKGDIAFVGRMLGVLYWQNEQPHQAQLQLQKSLATNMYHGDEQWRLRRMLATLLLSQGQYKQALPELYTLTKTVPKEENGAQIWLYIAQSHYQLQQWQPIIDAIQHYEKLSAKASVKALTLKLVAQSELKQWRALATTAKQLIELEPNKKVWWQQRMSAYIRLGLNKKALDVLSLAKVQGIVFSDTDYRTLAALYAQQGIYEQAARTLAQISDANSDTELLKQQAQYWQAAREWNKSMHYWQLAAHKDARYYWQLALLQNQQRDYDATLATLDKVKAKTHRYDAELMRVNALYKLNKIDSALAHARQAQTLKDTPQVQTWIRFLTQLKAQS